MLLDPSSRRCHHHTLRMRSVVDYRWHELSASPQARKPASSQAKRMKTHTGTVHATCTTTNHEEGTTNPNACQAPPLTKLTIASHLSPRQPSQPSLCPSIVSHIQFMTSCPIPVSAERSFPLNSIKRTTVLLAGLSTGPGGFNLARNHGVARSRETSQAA